MEEHLLDQIEPKEIFPGYRGKFIHSKNNTFVYWDIKADSPLPEHSHMHEQVVHVLDGIYSLIVNGEEKILKAGSIFAIPSNVKHSGKAQTDCTILDVFYPVREDYL